MLPKGILDTFEVTKVEEECTGVMDETNTEIRILHIYLDERDLRDEVWHDLRPNAWGDSSRLMARRFNVPTRIT